MQYGLSLADSGGIGSLFTALGLNVQALILNTAAFLVVVWIMGKFVYPPLTRALDAKRDQLEAAARAETDAKSALDEARAGAKDILGEARTAADELLAETRAETDRLIKESRIKAEALGKRIIDESHQQLGRDLDRARSELKVETARLVASATATIVAEKLTSRGDSELIERTLGVHR